jgi:hypothetical protein
MALLNFINCPNLKGEVLIDVMRRTVIPWSQDLDIQIQKVYLFDCRFCRINTTVAKI